MGNRTNKDALMLGMNMFSAMILFVGGGYLLDQRSGTGQEWTKIGILIGLIYCAYESFRIIQMINKD